MVTILEIINDSFAGVLGRIPSRNTIENWVKKCGLDIYNSTGNLHQSTDYAMVIDESMMIGSQKLLLTLGVPAKHQGSPLTLEDVSILDMAVSSSWNSDRIKDRLLVASDKVGYHPEYVISDNASIMTAGVSKAAFTLHRDISHSLGMLLERCYKNEEDFIAYTKKLTDAQLKYNMKKIAFLLPPKQRTIARFINLSDWVEWSRKMLNIYHNLSLEERTVFAFVPENASLIDELSEVIESLRYINEKCKHHGLSRMTIKQCLEYSQILFRGNFRMRTLGDAICGFLLEEGKILENKTNTHNNSSDVIESAFGIYKQRKSPNKLYGVTSFILFIPAYTKLSKKDVKNNSIKKHIENVKLAQIHQWEKANLMQNLVTKRIKTLNMAG